MTIYRRFRNTDPPALSDVWNESHTARGAYPIRTPAILERWILSKPYFDHDGLIVAFEEETGRVLGYALAGFAPTEDHSALSFAEGVICSIAVRPSVRRKHIGTDLMARCEAYLVAKGARTLRAGPVWPQAPFGFGFYGGTNSPGFLLSDVDSEPFFRSIGYAPAEQTLVFQKKLDEPLTIADSRFGMLRRRYDVQVLRAAAVSSWWQDCVWGTLEPVEFRMVDKLANNLPAARAVVWELEGYSWRWGFPSAGFSTSRYAPTCAGKVWPSSWFTRSCDSFRISFSESVNCKRPPTDPISLLSVNRLDSCRWIRELAIPSRCRLRCMCLSTHPAGSPPMSRGNSRIRLLLVVD